MGVVLMAQYVRKTDNPKMGRPRINIPVEEFEKLCAMQCTQEEIAGWYNCTIETIENFCHRTYKTTFLEIYKKLSSKGKMSLRRSQFRLAETNASMAIWLGKQYLGQKDRTDIDFTANVPSDGLFNALQKGLIKDND